MNDSVPTMMPYMISGVVCAPTSGRHAVVARLVAHLRTGRGTMRVVTVNPEILLRAHRDPRYRAAVQSAHLRTIDGIGAAVALWWRSGARSARVTGVDLMEEMCAYAQQRRLHVHCAVRAGGLSRADTVARVMHTRYPDARVTVHAYDVAEDADNGCMPHEDARDADIVLCGFGAPAQEYFTRQWAQMAGAHACVAIGVGGAFDFLTGRIRRAPRIVRAAGVEWAWRFVRQPQRIVRIARATIFFPLLIVTRRDAGDRAGDTAQTL